MEPTNVSVIDKEVTGLLTQYDNIIDRTSKFMKITSRVGDAKSLIEFDTLTDNHIETIAENMPAINRATKFFGRKNSQVTGRLMSLTMMASSPYRRLHQCLAKIEKKRSALKTNIFRLRKQKLQLDKLLSEKKFVQSQIDGVSKEYTHSEDSKYETQQKYFRIDEIDIEVEEIVSGISDSNVYIEGALKEIGSYQEAYLSIMKAHNIDEDWTEDDFEKAEIEEHIKMALLHTLRDIMMSGRLNVSTHEYLEQFGIHPFTAVKVTQAYLAGCDKMAKDNKMPNIQSLYSYLDDVFLKFKGDYKAVINRIGLDSTIDINFCKTSNGE